MTCSLPGGSCCCLGIPMDPLPSATHGCVWPASCIGFLTPGAVWTSQSSATSLVGKRQPSTPVFPGNVTYSVGVSESADLGYTIPSQGGTYWNGAAMQKRDYLELEETPKEVDAANHLVVANATHLAGLLREHLYAPVGG